MFGIENILCLTGDHTKMGDHPQAKPVFDLILFSPYSKSFWNPEWILVEIRLLVSLKFSKGAVVSPCSDSVDAQLAKWKEK